MIRHYYKRAFRNLIRYKAQTVTSVLGLAVGFACFALSAMWIRYEMNFDRFHKDADLIYQLRYKNKKIPGSYEYSCSNRIGDYLKKTFPEVSATTTLFWTPVFMDAGPSYYKSLSVDSTFFSFFHLEMLEGNAWQIPAKNGVIVSDRFVREQFGDKKMMGRSFEDAKGTSFFVAGICRKWPVMTNLPFDVLSVDVARQPTWNAYRYNVFVKLAPGVDTETFNQKLAALTVAEDSWRSQSAELQLVPLSHVRYDHPETVRNVKFDHVVIFALAGLLVILCSLFNFLTLFVSRMYARGKELALYKVSGASAYSIFALLCCEFLVILLLAVGVGCILIEWSLPFFLQLSTIQLDTTAVWGESILFCLGVVLLTMVCIAGPVFVIQRKTLSYFLCGKSGGSGKNRFRKISMIGQLAISMAFIFCTLVLVKQIYYLGHTDVGFDRTRVCRLSCYSDPVAEKLKKIPSIVQILPEQDTFLPSFSLLSYRVDDWEGKAESDKEPLEYDWFGVFPAFFDFYRIRLLEGQFPGETTAPDAVVVNEALRKRCGWQSAVGKVINGRTIEGVIADLYTGALTQKPKPVVYAYDKVEPLYLSYRYAEGTRKQTEEAIRHVLEEQFPDREASRFFYMETQYQRMMQSEESLRTLLGILSVVCILVSTFGTYSLAALMTGQRRKEIAVRKVHGATKQAIVRLFLGEYIRFVVVAAGIAFPAGYLIMRPWVQQFALQTQISWWIYGAILVLIALLIVLTVFSKLRQSIQLNAAEVIKGE